MKISVHELIDNVDIRKFSPQCWRNYIFYSYDLIQKEKEKINGNNFRKYFYSVGVKTVTHGQKRPLFLLLCDFSCYANRLGYKVRPDKMNNVFKF